MGKIKYYLLAIFACLGWSAAFVLIKLALEYAPVFQLSGLRFMLAGLLLLPFMFGQNQDWGAMLKEWKFVTIFSFVQIFVQYSLYFSGIDMVSPSAAAIIVGASPLVVFVMAHFALQNDRFTLSKIIAVTLGVTGIVVMTLRGGEGVVADNKLYLLGLLMVFGSVTANSYVNIMVAKNARPISAISLTAVSNFVGGVMLYACSIFETDRVSELTLPTTFWAELLGLALITSVGFSIWFYLLKVPTLKVSEINIWKFITPVFGVIFSWIFFADDSPDVSSVIGIVLITAAILTLQVPALLALRTKK